MPEQENCDACGGFREVIVDTTVTVTGMNPDGVTVWSKTETKSTAAKCTACGGSGKK